LYKQEIKEEVINCNWNWCCKLPRVVQILQKFLFSIFIQQLVNIF